jgi:cation transport regulator ChaC
VYVNLLVDDEDAEREESRGVADGQEPGEEEDYVWGVAYRIDPSKEDEVRDYLGKFTTYTRAQS